MMGKVPDPRHATRLSAGLGGTTPLPPVGNEEVCPLITQLRGEDADERLLAGNGVGDHDILYFSIVHSSLFAAVDVDHPISLDAQSHHAATPPRRDPSPSH